MAKLLEKLGIDTEKYKTTLLTEGMYGLEESLHKFVMTEIYDKIAKELLDSVLGSIEFETKVKTLAKHQRLGKLQKREVSLLVHTP